MSCPLGPAAAPPDIAATRIPKAQRAPGRLVAWVLKRQPGLPPRQRLHQDIVPAPESGKPGRCSLVPVQEPCPGHESRARTPAGGQGQDDGGKSQRSARKGCSGCRLGAKSGNGRGGRSCRTRFRKKFLLFFILLMAYLCVWAGILDSGRLGSQWAKGGFQQALVGAMPQPRRRIPRGCSDCINTIGPYLTFSSSPDFGIGIPHC